MTAVTIYSHLTGQGYEAWPALSRMSNNQLLCIFSDGTAHLGNNTIIKGSISTDHGATWGAAFTICDESASSHRCLSNLGMAVLASGRILMPYAREANGTFVELGARIASSTNNGATWNATYGSIAVPSGYDYAYPYGTIRELTPGGTLYMPAYGSNTGSGHTDSFLLKSTDTGVNWTLQGVIAAGDATHEYFETDIVNIGGNNWLAAVRQDNTHSLRTCNSTDNGATWDTPALFDSTGGVSPCLYGITASHVILTYAIRQSPFGIVIWESMDGGVTWPQPGYVYLYSAPDGDMGYAAMAPSGGTLYAAYYDSNHDVEFITTGFSVPPDSGGTILKANLSGGFEQLTGSLNA